jgi:hypothetical protein
MPLLGADGFVCHRATSAPIEDFVVYGERSSGTNVTKKIIRDVYGLRPTKAYGWKHGAPSIFVASARSLFIVSLRDAFDWCVSMYAKPYHVAEEIRAHDFDTFIRTPWLSVMNAPKPHGLDPRLHRDQVLQPDRHIMDGRPYRNLFEMRTVKMQAWLGLLNRGVNVVIMRHEDFQRDPQGYAGRIAAEFGLTEKRPFKTPEYIFERRRVTETRRTHAKARLPHNLEYIRAQLDHALEKSVGYDAPPSHVPVSPAP